MANQVNTLTNQGVMLDLYKIHAYIPNDAEGNPLTPFGNFSAGYEAASQHYEREIAELNKQYLTLQDSTTLIANKYLELSAQVNKLREALLKIQASKTARYEVEADVGSEVFDVLETTAPQSLQAFENEVLERAAKVCDRYHYIPDAAHYDCAKAIREMKSK